MDALGEYQSRERAAITARDELERVSRRIGNARLAVAILFIASLWLVVARHVSWWIAGVPVAVFAFLFVWHTRVQRRRGRAALRAEWYRSGIERVEDNWIGTGSEGERFQDAAHPYSGDLDLFGRGSLFQFLSRARTTVGEAALARWLLEAAIVEEAQARQLAAQELATALDLREDVALIGATAHAVSDPARLTAWANEPRAAVSKAARPLAFALALLGMLTAVLCLAVRAPLFPFLIVFAASIVFSVWLRATVGGALAGLETSAADLESLSALIERMEREQFQAPRLEQIRGALSVEGLTASRRIAKLRRLIELFESTDHILLRIVNPVLLLRQQIALAILKWRRTNAHLIPEWLDAVASFEALSSIAALTFERPAWTFPELNGSEMPAFRARGLCHALLPAAKAVPNNVELGDPAKLLIISGSNMSGKSTLLRSVGVAAVLAWAGAPVPARELNLSRLRVGASLRTTDSLQDNRSRFMAEVLRLRQIVGLTKSSGPVLFLLDELLSGTNSHDRRIGASAIVRGLLDAQAIGMITTHDLALTGIAEEAPGHAINVHFTDEIKDGELHFDYRLRPGVVTHSNALELMRAVGLIA